jgi:sialidase-1
MESKKTSLIPALIGILIIINGAIIALLPVFFWDFLVTYQFRPTVRPFYPLFYGSIFTTGIVIIGFGILGLKNLQRNQDEENKKPRLKYIPAIGSLIVAIAVPFATGTLFSTTLYLAADGLYYLILTGLILGILVAILLSFSAIHAILQIKSGRPVSKAGKLANTIPLLFMLLGVVIVGVIYGPPDAECLPFPDDLPFNTTLYAQGDGGYHTFKIPTMITAVNGTILVFAEARADNQEDWGKMDMVVRKSYDGGDTWTPLEVVVEDGDLTIGNTCPVVDQSTGYIWIIFCKENDLVFKMHSKDNGETWSTPIEITPDVKLDTWGWYATGPSHGIQLGDGTLVIPADHIVDRKMQAHVIYSTDHGETWKLGGTVPTGEEATLVELDNGDLYINIRPVKPGYRVTAISKDKGLTWEEIVIDESLPDSACQGSMIRMPNPDAPSASIYLFSNPADSLHREKMTIRISYDQCQTWADSKLLYAGMASYSALSLIDPGNNLIGCVFERGCNYYAEEIVFTRFSLAYIQT